MFVAAMSLLVYAIVVAQRLVAGDFSGGFYALWDRDILQFFLIGVVLFGVGLVGEYVGRIYQQVRDRPRYTIRAVLERRRTDEATRTQRSRDRDSAHDHAPSSSPITTSARAACACCWRTASRAAGRHARGQSRRDDLVRARCRRRGRLRHSRRSRRRTPTPPTPSRASRALAPDFLFSFYYRQMLGQRCSPFRRAARSTCTARCCPSTAAARR